MALECKPNKGVLFYDNSEDRHEMAPDLSGEICVTPSLMKDLKESNNGDNLRIVAWENTSKNGNKYFSIGLSVPNIKMSSSRAPEVKLTKPEEDNLPF
tara:strand:- start:6107 stop:6400 length:294 start_codon:yes stop_codon:yes gene_type:complete